MIELPRESVEFVPLTVTLDGKPVNQGIELATTQGSARPTVWAPATVLDGKAGLVIDGLPVGEHIVWVRVSSAPEAPVLRCARIRIT